MKYVVTYVVGSEAEYLADFAWRRDVGLKQGRMLPYGDGSAEISIEVECDEHLAMLKLRRSKMRVIDYWSYYAIPMESNEDGACPSTKNNV